MGGTFVGFIEQEFCSHHHTYGATNLLDSHLENELKDAAAAQQVALRLARVALHVLSEASHEYNYRIAENEQEFMFERVRDTVADYCEAPKKDRMRIYHDETFGVQLPTGWDQPPVHRTEFNCWYCGVFAGNMQEKLTQRDLHEDGWIDNGKDGVFCSEAHLIAFTKAQGKPVAAAKLAARKAKRK